MASSEEPRLSHVKVGETLDYVGDYSGSSSRKEAGNAVKRRRVSHDYRKLSKLGYGPSVSAESEHAMSPDSKGKVPFVVVSTLPTDLNFVQVQN